MQPLVPCQTIGPKHGDVSIFAAGSICYSCIAPTGQLFRCASPVPTICQDAFSEWTVSVQVCWLWHLQLHLEEGIIVGSIQEVLHHVELARDADYAKCYVTSYAAWAMCVRVLGLRHVELLSFESPVWPARVYNLRDYQ